MHCCKICNKEIPKRYFDSVRKYLTRIVCSRSCYREYCNTPEQKEFYKKNRAKSKGLLGYKFTDVQRATLKKALTGRKFSEEARRNIALGHTGEKAYNWRGVTPKKLRIRGFAKTNEWREQIFKRDNYTCQCCGIRGGNLHADHIKPFSIIINEMVDIFGVENIVEYARESTQLWDISNGRTLCISCHKKTPVYANTKKEYKNIMQSLLFNLNTN